MFRVLEAVTEERKWAGLPPPAWVRRLNAPAAWAEAASDKTAAVANVSATQIVQTCQSDLPIRPANQMPIKFFPRIPFTLSRQHFLHVQLAATSPIISDMAARQAARPI